MLNVRAWTLSSACWMAVTFTICVLGGVLVPSLPIPHRTLELVLPGFRWISASAFLLGLVETALYGMYAGWLFATLHNVIARRSSKTYASATRSVV